MAKAQDGQQNLEQEVRQLIATVLEAEPATIKPDAKFVEDLGMDSMMALEILAALEKKFRITIPEDSLPKFTTLNTTVTIIKGILDQKK
ncbi:MAG: acyl carrier protein [Candidatus Omnitrophota bacterium]